MLVILCGPPCTGKSAIGADLESRFGFIHLDVDAIRQRILPDSNQNIEDRNAAYRAMHLMAEFLLRQGATVVVDATYNRGLHRKELAATLKTVETHTALIQCKAPLDVVLARFKSRPPGHAALDLTEDLVRELWTNFAYSSDGLTIDTSQPSDVDLDRDDSLERWIQMK
jgi:predicted kinase